ncbi:MAG: hypothetical protein GKR87_01120 [Kiritimatiellae bacterium]|nr:hypothetical protein [Kiritimatiellia bacterium]
MKPSQPNRFFRVVRMTAQLLFISVLVLLAWPTGPSGETGVHKDALSFYRKIVRMDHAIRKDTPLKISISEREINGYFADLIQNNFLKKKADLFTSTLRTINLAFTPKRFKLILVGKWGPIPFSYELRGIPLLKDKKFGIEVLHVKWGQMILPRATKNWFTARLGALFDKLKRERFVFTHIDEATLGAGNILLIIE